MGIEKYKELYDLSNSLLSQEHDRFNRIDVKAGSYLSVITLLIGIEGAYGNSVLKGFFPPTTWVQWLVLVTAILSFLMLAATWFVIFRTLRIHALRIPPLNQEMVDFFHIQSEVNIYYHIARANSLAWEENRRVTDKKSKALFYGYRMIIATVILLVLFISLCFVATWSKVASMSGDQKSHQTPGNKIEPPGKTNAITAPTPTSRPASKQHRASVQPDPHVKPPTYVSLANERQNPEV
jgi:hypothetical protein